MGDKNERGEATPGRLGYRKITLATERLNGNLSSVVEYTGHM